MAGSGGAAGGAGGTSGGTGGAAAGSGGGGSAADDWHAVKASPGCGTDPGIPANDDWSTAEIEVKSPDGHAPMANGQPLPATLMRKYAIKLPKGYDNNKKYKLLFTSPGCGGGFPVGSPNWTDVMAGDGIQVELHYYDGVWGAGSADGKVGPWCFDDKRGPTTIEKPYIETLFPYLEHKLCFDEHRVFMAAHSSGGWLSNQFGNAYGMQILRAVAPSSGGLAQGAQQQPGNGKEVTGMWWHQTNDGTNPFTGTQKAIENALMRNHCTDTNFATSPQEPIDFDNVNICKKFTSCPADFPIILCREPGSDHADAFNDGNQRAAAWKFFTSLP